MAGKRDLAILLLLIGCDLRRAELLRLEVKDLQQREASWMLPDLVGKGNRVRTVTVPAGVKARIDGWTPAAGITEGRLFRPVTKADAMTGTGILAEKDVRRLVVSYARETELGKLVPQTYVELARNYVGEPAVIWSRPSFDCEWCIGTGAEVMSTHS